MAKSHPLDRLLERFEAIPDPRVNRQQRHGFAEVIVLTIIGFLGNCNDWVAVERFANARLEWLRTFLKLEHGVPSHDTIGRIFALLRPKEFAAIWEAWMREVCEGLNLKQVAIDGKTMCHSGREHRKALHVVTAFATENGLSLAQEVVHEKSNEITAIPELLRKLDISRSMVTIDAMGCQKKIAAEIRLQQADYLLGVKGNQPKLLAAMESYTLRALEQNYVGIEHDRFEQQARSHGRDESRTCYVFRDVVGMELPPGWKDLKSVVMVVSERGEKGKSVSEIRYYISSRKASAKQMLKYTRDHWEIENGLHWQLDITFDDDDSRLREGHGPENAALVKRIALSILKNAQVGKEKWMSGKRQLAALDPKIMESILSQFLAI
jgi:predicted transposase YbfD/YdcC